ncbi:MAG: NUDIX hydrolase [Spirochaetales bacterium]|nr:MAG: NUDIX hydrolase [Spirochaetales bacterium]
MEHLHWKEISREKILSCNIFEIYNTTSVTDGGLSSTFTIIHPPDWANVVPITRDEKGRECFLMVHQYRQGSQSVTMEFPGGVLEESEKPEDGARRELLEETGHIAGKFHFAGRINPNPAIMDNWCYTYIAEDLQKAGSQQLDAMELVDGELIPVEEVEKNMGEGPLFNAIIVAAFMWYEKWKRFYKE